MLQKQQFLHISWRQFSFISFFSQVICCGLEQSIQTEWIFWMKHFWFRGKTFVHFLPYCHYSPGNKNFAWPRITSPKNTKSKNWYNLFPVLYHMTSTAPKTLSQFKIWSTIKTDSKSVSDGFAISDKHLWIPVRGCTMSVLLCSCTYFSLGTWIMSTPHMNKKAKSRRRISFLGISEFPTKSWFIFPSKTVEWQQLHKDSKQRKRHMK